MEKPCMSEAEKDPLHEQLQSLIGSHISKPTQAADEVNMAMIHQWTDAFSDRNPVYEDKALATTTRHGDLIAPPAMLQTWTMARPKIDNLAARGGLTVDIDQKSP
ncbi:MAG: MaoC family dehydratase N-terminal domain-containing protein, partial [Pseudomonadales bacterium]|nr:MaoC family dehydratase N-terminal domain-containing protein [Pseudomonadales bacterium]